MPAGRPKAVNSPKQLWDWFQAYVKAIKANPILVHDFVGKDACEVERRKERPLTMVGYENYVADVGGPAELKDYFANKDDAYSEFSPICSRIKKEIQADQIEGGMVGIYNPSITQRLNNLVEKTQHTIIEQPLFGDED